MLLENVQVLIISDAVDDAMWTRSVGAYRIATEIRNAGYTCQVIDCFTSFTEEELYKIFDKVIGDNTLMVGLSSTFFRQVDVKQFMPSIRPNTEVNGFTLNYPYSVEKMQTYFDYIKSINSKIKIVMGGGLAEYLFAPGTDTFITGLGDVAIIEYLKFLQNKNPFLSYRVNDSGQMIIAGDDMIGRFEFETSFTKFLKEDNILHGEVLSIEVSRGCIFKCKFCNSRMLGKKKNDYIKTHTTLKDEFIRNYEEYGLTTYVYVDDTHNDNVVKLQRLADVVQSLPFKLEYSAFIRIDLMRKFPEMYQLLKDGGIKGALFGIESLNHEALKAIGKGLHPDRVVEELHNFKDRLPHVGTFGSFICGLPYETKESVTEWADRIYSNDFPLDSVRVVPLFLTKSRVNDKNILYRSEFEIDHEKYYTFDPNNNNVWDNGNFQYPWAVEFCRAWGRREDFSERMRIAGWDAVRLRNIFPNMDYVKMPRSVLGSFDKLAAGVRQRKRQYVDKVFDL